MDKHRQPGNGMRRPRIVPPNKGTSHRAPKYNGNLHGTSKVKTKIPTPIHAYKEESLELTQVMQKQKKLFILDTNVLMHDWHSLLKFEIHDIYIPIMVIHELDKNKKGYAEAAMNSRRASNFIESLMMIMEAHNPEWTIEDGLDLELAKDGTPGMGRIFIQTDADAFRAARLVTKDSEVGGDDNIISAMKMLIKLRGRKYSEIRLVSNDLNMRILARSNELLAEGYTSDRVSTNGDSGVYSGMISLPEAIKARQQMNNLPNQQNSGLWEIDIPEGVELFTNQLITDGTSGVGWIVSSINGDVAQIRHCKNYIVKNPMYGINAKNAEQNFLLNSLLDPEIDLVTILGEAGTGKTLLTVVAALQQKQDEIYNGIIFTRATIPVGSDIGYLPGDESDKMGSWLGALEDNLEVIAESMDAKTQNGDPIKQLRDKHSRAPATKDDGWGETDSVIALRRNFKLKAISFMRGRSFLRKFLIIDEAQNLTPDQMKTLITRAGPGTKIVCLGNLGQIDTPYLDELSTGIAYTIDRFSGWRHYAHITLSRGERSRLSGHAIEVM